MAAPLTPRPAPGIKNDKPKTDTFLDSYIRKLLPTIFITLAAILTLKGSFVFPAARITDDKTIVNDFPIIPKPIIEK